MAVADQYVHNPLTLIARETATQALLKVRSTDIPSPLPPTCPYTASQGEWYLKGSLPPHTHHTRSCSSSTRFSSSTLHFFFNVLFSTAPCTVYTRLFLHYFLYTRLFSTAYYPLCFSPLHFVHLGWMMWFSAIFDRSKGEGRCCSSAPFSDSGTIVKPELSL